jgi:hypothetical protein
MHQQPAQAPLAPKRICTSGHLPGPAGSTVTPAMRTAPAPTGPRGLAVQFTGSCGMVSAALWCEVFCPV